MSPAFVPGELPELTGLTEAEEFFEALGVRYDPAVLASRRLQILRRFGLAVDAFLRERPGASPGERRAALRGALREAHEACAEGAALTPFRSGPVLVHLGRRR